MGVPENAAQHGLIAKLAGLVALAESYQSNRQFDKAEETYRTILGLAPGWVEAQSNLGTVLQSLGRLEEAAELYQRALALRPDFPEILYNLANVWKAQGKLEEAVERYEQALALRPDYADVHNNLGVALQELRKTDQAIPHYRRALELKPDYGEALNNLGAALLEQGDLGEALVECRKALALNPRDGEAHNNLAISLQHQRKLDDAEFHFQQALALKPGYVKALNNLGTLFKEKGEFSEAKACYDRALALQADFAEAHYNRAEVMSFRPGDAGLGALESLVQDGGLPDTKRLYIHFALSKALDDIADYSHAMEHMLAGNALKRREVNYDESDTQRFFQTIREAFAPDVFERFRGAGDPSTVPVFVLGMPRSGSTLVEQILASHPLVEAAGELDNLNQVSRSRQDLYAAGIARSTAGDLQRLGQAYLEGLPALAPGKVRITDKSPLNFFHVGLIRLILPNAKIIHTVRDPIDTCISCFSKLFTFEMKFTYDLAELGRYYRSYRELMTHWHSVLPPGSILDVSYEDLVENFDEQVRRLLDHCGLPWDERCLSFYRTARPVATASAFQVRQPLFRSSLDRRRHYQAYLQPLVDEIAPLLSP